METNDVTRSDIVDFHEAALEACDYEISDSCKRALNGCEVSWRDCALRIRDRRYWDEVYERQPRRTNET